MKFIITDCSHEWLSTWSRKERKYCIADEIRFNNSRSNRSVWMHSKYFCGIVSVELLNVLDELRHISNGWHVVISTLRELNKSESNNWKISYFFKVLIAKYFVIFFENLWTIEISKDDTNKPSVFGVSYSSTIVSFCYHVVQGFVWHFIIFV